jgi:hypothetical protein
MRFVKYCCILVIFLLLNCGRTTIIGEDLLGDDSLSIKWIDTSSLVAYTLPDESVKTFDPFDPTFIETFLIGNLNDPIFGTSRSELTFAITPERSRPVYDSITIDSIILVLAVDTTKYYGNPNAQHSLEVYQVQDLIDINEEYQSDTFFNVDPIAIGGKYDFTLEDIVTDSLDIWLNPDFSEKQLYPPHLRIPMTDLFADYLVENNTTLIYDTESSFVEFIKGLQLKSTLVNDAFLAFDLNGNFNELTMFFKNKNGENDQYDYSVNTLFARHLHYDLNHENSIAQQFVDNKELGDSLIFLQPMGGLKAAVEFPHLEFYKDKIINEVELEMTIATLAEDNPNFSSALQIATTHNRVADGEEVFVNDFYSNFLFSKDVLPISGGRLVEEKEGSLILEKYKVNLSNQFKDILSGESENKVFLVVYPDGERVARSIIFGPGHATHPMKLNVTYTEQPQ